jgi:hypothetical protein
VQPEPIAPDPVPVEPEPVDPGPQLARIEPEETWPLFHGTSPLEAWEIGAGARGDWSPAEETRNGAQATVLERSGAERDLPAPPWLLTGNLRVVSRRASPQLSLFVRLGPEDALELRQAIVDDEVRLVAERVRGPSDAAERTEVPELALEPLARATYTEAAPVEFRVQWDGERLSVAWKLARGDGPERTLALPAADFAGPVRLGFELQGGTAVLQDFVVTGL